VSAIKREDVIALEERYQLKTYRKLPFVVERGEGTWIWDASGRKYLDFYGGHCVTLLGHSHPDIVEALKSQADQILFYSNLVYSEIRARAAERLARLAPDGLRTVFFCNSGTEANETALKLARKQTGRDRILAFEGDFHGRTLGSLATTWDEHYRAPYVSVLPETTFVPLNDERALRSAFETGQAPAAVLVEPIQSIAGMTSLTEASARILRDLCTEYGTALIFDEVQTGVGRTGTFSISEQLGVRPDLITLAKSLGGGMPVGAVLVGEEIAAGVEYGDQGTTFGGGMMAMAAVLATLNVLTRDDLMARASVVQGRITVAAEAEGVRVLGKGCLLGLQLRGPASPVLSALRDRSVIAGGSSRKDVIRLMPPLTVTDEELEFFSTAFSESVRATAEQSA